MKDLVALIPVTEGDNPIRLYDLEASTLLVSKKTPKEEIWKVVRFDKPTVIYKENYVNGRNVSENYIKSGTKQYPLGSKDFEPTDVFMNLHRLNGKLPAGGWRITGSLHLVGNDILKWFRDEKVSVKTDEFGTPEIDNFDLKGAAQEERRYQRTKMMPAALAKRP